MTPTRIRPAIALLVRILGRGAATLQLAHRARVARHAALARLGDEVGELLHLLRAGEVGLELADRLLRLQLAAERGPIRTLELEDRVRRESAPLETDRVETVECRAAADSA